jgi:lysyl-tRNA synthetase class 1
MRNREALEAYLRKPITRVPDPEEKEESYARAHERELEKLLPLVGVEPDYIYQAERYRRSEYAEGIKKALEHRETIRSILNSHRTQPLSEDWWPVSIFCTACERDTTQVEDYDGEWKLTYSCASCGNREELDLRETHAVKLPWRIDWPMRWTNERVDFEPAGKDHHSEGGSFDTAREIVDGVFGGEAPISFQYDFIRIKGRGGKISSSTGDVVSLRDVLAIYEPEIVRYLFVSTRPNTEFAISFDLDVLKIYEDYDKCERIYFDREEVGEKRKVKEKRIYELSQVKDVPAEIPYQAPFRHLCNLLQIHGGDIEKAIDALGDVADAHREKVRVRARCAWNWITTYAPEDFRFSLRSPDDTPIETSDAELEAIRKLKQEIASRYEEHDEKSLSGALFEIARSSGLEPKQFFQVVYRALIGREKGPRLANFIRTVGKDRILEVLSPYE